MPVISVVPSPTLKGEVIRIKPSKDSENSWLKPGRIYTSSEFEETCLGPFTNYVLAALGRRLEIA